ncbi:MAG: hypothetical protein AMJ70_02060 [Dehalococcoidia bacterium SG8_51_3]|nr:MAG: hypothetical protein AMJ70_02060 [Dehalococcoidia bacterium SG8_51_3]
MKKSDRRTQDLQKPEIRGTIERVISPTNDHTQLLRFMLHLEKICNSDNHSASIISKGGSFDRGAFIAISSRSNSPADLLNEIGNMPEVEKVEEEPPGNGFSSRLSTLFAYAHLLHYVPRKRFRIILNGTKE